MVCGSRRAAVEAVSVTESKQDDNAVASQPAGCLVQRPLDVRSSQSVEAFCAAVTAEFEAIDMLVNCAGVSLHQTMDGHTEAQWTQVIDTNLNGTYRMIRAVLPLMINRRWGRIVNIASTAAHVAEPGYAAYCASKAGVLGLTRTVALEGAAHGVNCVSVSPGWVETPMLLNSAREIAQASGQPVEQVIDDMRCANPQQRLVQVTDVAALVAFLCSDAATALTMEDFQVNAGALW